MKKLKLLLPFLFLCLSSFADMGSCSLSQGSDGHYTIYCQGDGLVLQYETLTNEVFVIGNCTGLVSQLNEAYNDLVHDVVLLRNYIANAQYGLSDSYNMVGYLESSTNSGELVTVADARQGISYAQNQLNLLQIKLDDIIHSMDSTESDTDLKSLIDSIDCGSCSSGGDGGGGSCCDFSEILDYLNTIVDNLDVVVETMGQYDDDLDSDSFGRIKRLRLLSNGSYDISLLDPSSVYIWNQANILEAIYYNTRDILPSINNWLAYISEKQIKPVSESLFADSPIYYYPENVYSNYYTFLTNHYISASKKHFRGGASEGEKALTNWFARVETLLAALVFADGEASTNEVFRQDFASTQKDILVDSLSGLTDTANGQFTRMHDTGQGILDSLRIIQGSFSRFSTLPNQVEVVRFSDDSSDVVSFGSGEMIYLLNACRCATTLAWCVGGVWLLWIFLSWSFRSCYNLVVFVWNLIGSIFSNT